MWNCSIHSLTRMHTHTHIYKHSHIQTRKTRTQPHISCIYTRRPGYDWCLMHSRSEGKHARPEQSHSTAAGQARHPATKKNPRGQNWNCDRRRANQLITGENSTPATSLLLPRQWRLLFITNLSMTLLHALTATDKKPQGTTPSRFLKNTS